MCTKWIVLVMQMHTCIKFSPIDKCRWVHVQISYLSKKYNNWNGSIETKSTIEDKCALLIFISTVFMLEEHMRQILAEIVEMVDKEERIQEDNYVIMAFDMMMTNMMMLFHMCAPCTSFRPRFFESHADAIYIHLP